MQQSQDTATNAEQTTDSLPLWNLEIAKVNNEVNSVAANHVSTNGAYCQLMIVYDVKFYGTIRGTIVRTLPFS